MKACAPSRAAAFDAFRTQPRPSSDVLRLFPFTTMAEPFGLATAAIGLAATVFQTAKGIRDTVNLVGFSPLILASPRCLLVARVCRQCLRTRRSRTFLRRTRQR